MAINLQVLFEDNHLLVVNKPAVLATMGVAEDQSSLLNECKAYLKRKYSKPGNVYLGVVSRLDSFVTGAIVFARTSKAASRLSQQFQSRSVDKKYLAIVSGKRPPASETLENWLIKNDGRRRMVAVQPGTDGAKAAKLQYQTLAGCRGHGTDLYLLEVELHTGRKHQIRVQLSERGMPIMGDRKYDSELPFENGIALHSRFLAFDHPTTKSRITINCDPPKYWKMQRFSL